ncbi:MULTISPECIES: hypothetical protein [Bacillus]|uniref:hypothetical protein n=1 Tax=Bacillus TaxID=1386 RepID=UPI00031BB3C9|nr:MULTISPECIES: hypothetical protein [Bacillus]
MENIVPIKGNVKYSITLDPGVWILDDRKIKLNDFFEGDLLENDHIEEYTKAVSKHWDKEIIEGNEAPPKNPPKKKFIREEMRTETYAIHFHHFLKNSEPNETATEVIVQTTNEEIAFPIKDAMNFVLCFSNQGKALKEDGPIHVYYGKNQKQKITHVQAFLVK